MRPRFDWRLRTRTLALGDRTLVMGVVNVTPDSFSDGGDFFHTDQAIGHALELLQEGAHVIDVGGESTRPGKKIPVSEQEELRRVVPVIAGILRAAPKAIISVDTHKVSVAEEAVRKGAEIVNDVSALTSDPVMAATLARLECGVVLMHSRGRPEDWRMQPADPDINATVKAELAAVAQRALDAGISRDRIVLDPGFGFGKNFDENYPLLARMNELHSLGYPLLSGTSRKSFIGRTLARNGADLPAKDRLLGTMATVTASVLKGAHIVRVHDVEEAAQTVRIADAILRAGA